MTTWDEILTPTPDPEPDPTLVAALMGRWNERLSAMAEQKVRASRALSVMDPNEADVELVIWAAHHARGGRGDIILVHKWGLVIAAATRGDDDGERRCRRIAGEVASFMGRRPARITSTERWVAATTSKGRLVVADTGVSVMETIALVTAISSHLQHESAMIPRSSSAPFRGA